MGLQAELPFLQLSLVSLPLTERMTPLNTGPGRVQVRECAGLGTNLLWPGKQYKQHLTTECGGQNN